MTQGFLNRGAEAYSTPRFVMLYRRWQKHGDVVFEDAASPVLADALANGSGLVECLVLPHAYRHLSPLATLVRSIAQGVEKGETGRGTHLRTPSTQFLNPSTQVRARR